MLLERRERLEALSGWVWNKHAYQWEEGFASLASFEQEHTHCQVPANYKTKDGFKLGSWVVTQRSQKEGIAEERKNRLKALKGWVWDVLSAQWEEGFVHLKEYANEHGDCQVPVRYKTMDGYSLGSWVNRQRTRKETVTLEHKERLEALGFDWKPFETAWEEGFSHLKEYVDKNGDCLVPVGYKTKDNFNLRSWVNGQRSHKDALSPERRHLLEALGFVWNTFETAWEEGFAHLKDYVDSQGDCRMPALYKTTHGFRLGGWVRV